MTRQPFCCLPNDSVLIAADMMKKENIGSIPVVENQQNRVLIGIVTDRDLALKVVAEGREGRATKVDQIMTREMITCSISDDLQVALDAMAKHQLRRLPVVDAENKIQGIISQADIATRLNKPDETAELVKRISHSNVK
jgi:CBS domain-containing protein